MITDCECLVLGSPLNSFLFAGRNEASLAGGRRPKPDSVTTRLRRTFASIWWAWTCLARRKTSTAAAATTTTATSAIPGKKSRRSELEIGFDAISNGKPRTYTHTHARTHTHTPPTLLQISPVPPVVYFDQRTHAHMGENNEKRSKIIKKVVFLSCLREAHVQKWLN